MKGVLIDIRNEGEQIKRIFKNKDLVSIEDLLDKISELDDELDYVQEQFEDFKRDVEDNYRPITLAEQYDISDKDFIC